MGFNYSSTPNFTGGVAVKVIVWMSNSKLEFCQLNWVTKILFIIGKHAWCNFCRKLRLIEYSYNKSENNKMFTFVADHAVRLGDIKSCQRPA